MKADFVRQVRALAELNGVQTSFVDAAKQRQTAPPEVLLRVLHALGVSAANQSELGESLRASRLRPFRRGIEPAIVAWDQQEVKIGFYLPAKLAQKRVKISIRFEDGKTREIKSPVHRLGMTEVEGERFVVNEFVLPRLPFGYYTLEISVDDVTLDTMVISSPMKCFPREAGRESGTPPSAGTTSPSPIGWGRAGVRVPQLSALNCSWGAFLPMYAAHSRTSWGAGNVSDWERLARWIGSLGGTVAGTLPLLAAFLDYPVCEPSPYSPASRLFWNEFYLDITRVPELKSCRAAQSLIRSRSFQTKLHAFRRSELVDYPAQWRSRRAVLELLAQHFFSKGSSRRGQFEKFLRQRPEVKDYAAFRAICEKLKTSWHGWPQRLREGSISECDYDLPAQQFHLYVQWLAHEQIAELIHRSEQNGVQLYLDLPVGVHPDSYDVWRERDSFALVANAGAPPDLFFSKGQDWGFPPLHPHRIRENGYRYVLAFLRFQMRHARWLRIDHVMGLHRLYWVPHGFEARHGTYVNYPAHELHAVLNLESHRHRTRLVGENLGTVPPAVNESMARHRLRGMYVVQFEERRDPKAALPNPPTLSVASLNTHDTPTFAAHWAGDDLVESVRLGLLPRGELKHAKAQRQKLKATLVQFLTAQGLLKPRKPPPREVLRALLVWLRSSDAELVLVTLEDLWLERRPQNVPGTSTERPNWRRKARFSLEKLLKDLSARKLIPSKLTNR